MIMSKKQSVYPLSIAWFGHDPIWLQPVPLSTTKEKKNKKNKLRPFIRFQTEPEVDYDDTYQIRLSRSQMYKNSTLHMACVKRQWQ